MFHPIVKFTHQSHRLALRQAIETLQLYAEHNKKIKKKPISIIVSVKNIVKYFFLSILTKRPCVLYYTGLGRLYMLNGKIGKMIVFLTAYILDRWCAVGFIVENQENKEYFEKFATNPVYLVSGSGLYPDYFQRITLAEKQKNMVAGKVTLGYLARFGPLKHSELILELAMTIPEHIEIVIAGRDVKGSFYTEKFQKLAEENSNITFIGHLDSHDKISAFYNRIDWLLHPSMSEGLPLTLLEAVWHHVPFMTTPVCGCEKTGKIFNCPIIHAEKFVDYVRSDDYWQKPPDRKQWEKKLQPFYYQNVQKEFEAILQDILKNQK